MKRKVISAVLLLSMLMATVYPTESADEISEIDWGAIVYIPLDDRPFHQERLEQMAHSLNLTLVMPDQDLYATKLDGHGTNSNGTQYGDRGALFEWLMEQAEHYDTFLISLDQLLSGGLMNSRCMTEMESIELSDGTIMSEYDILDYIQQLAETKQVYVIDSVLRLASANGYGGYTMEDYTATRSYGLLSRPVLQGDAVTVDNIISTYSAVEGTAEISDEQIQTYLKVRQRKLLLMDYSLRHLIASENVHYIFGVDDSSDGINIQTNEIAYIRRFIGDDALIFSALDGTAQLVLAEIYRERREVSRLQVQISYMGGDGSEVPAFNYKSVAAMIQQNISYYGGEIVEAQPQLAIIAVFDSGEKEMDTDTFSQVIQTLNENECSGVPTILLDFTAQNTTLLHQMLAESVHLGSLLSYSGTYEGVVCAAMAVSQGVARYISLSDSLSAQAQKAHAESLATALIKDFFYTDGGKAAMDAYFDERGEVFGDFENTEPAVLTRYNKALTQKLKSSVQALLDNLESSNFMSSQNARYAIQSISIGDCSYPWYRTFEFSCPVSVEISSEPYQQKYHRAYINGTGGGVFEPDGQLTRSQAAKLVVAISETDVLSAEYCVFADVEDWAKPYVAAAYINGYMKGYLDGSFRGENSITRGELAALLCQYINATGMKLEKSASAYFTDLSRSSTAWYTNSVYTLADAGVITGYTDGSVQPEATITRAEAVVMLGRLFDRNDTMPQWLLSRQRFTDVPQSFWAYAAITEASCSHFAA